MTGWVLGLCLPLLIIGLFGMIAENQKWRFAMGDNKDRYLLFGCLYMAFTAIMSALVILNVQSKSYEDFIGQEWIWFPVILTIPILITATGMMFKLLNK